MIATTSVTTSPTNRRSMAWKATLLLIPVLTAVGLFSLRQAQVRHNSARLLPSLGQAPNFQLTNQNKEPFASDKLAGKVWIAGFIFTNCAGPCPLISSRMADLQKPLENTDVQLVTFTVDPERDTPEVLHEYARRLKAEPGRWTFLTGSPAAINELSRQGFKLALEPGADDGPVHTTRLVLVDRGGVIRGYYDALAADAVARLLADSNQLQGSR